MKKALLFSLVLLVALPASAAPVGGGAADAPTAVLSDEADADAAGEESPDGYTLSAAYPNPFQSRTRFQLSVDHTQRVTVEVYNVLGQRVRSVFSGLLQEGRARSFTFKAQSLPSGLYLYRVKGETFTATRRVTLVR